MNSQSKIINSDWEDGAEFLSKKDNEEVYVEPITASGQQVKSTPHNEILFAFLAVSVSIIIALISEDVIDPILGFIVILVDIAIVTWIAFSNKNITNNQGSSQKNNSQKRRPGIYSDENLMLGERDIDSIEGMFNRSMRGD
ncbi:hypothetical protein [Thiomicrorhabdus aquaedulcis]|uniref:hypothetical protein n=1 Tax=Thiomicrorhabdus aquaedulcis TaxID=2211106 RepID=UPI000FD6D74F|nr:hypothetical protein [Thiomicrorhabdus aquaedulcis]